MRGLALRAQRRTEISPGDYVLFHEEVRIKQHETTLRIAAGSIGRFVRPAWDAASAVVLLGSWHIRVRRRAVCLLRDSDRPLPYPWTDKTLHQIVEWDRGRDGGRVR